MSTPSLSLSCFPNDILGIISSQCNERTLSSFRQTSRAFNEIGKEYMSEEVAARIIYHQPERYLDLRLNTLKESRRICTIALTKLPELIFNPEMPEKIRLDPKMIKTAYIAARVLGKDGISRGIIGKIVYEQKEFGESFLADLFLLYRIIESLMLSPYSCVGIVGSEKKETLQHELLSSFPFVEHVLQHATHLTPLPCEWFSKDVLENIDLIIALLKKHPDLIRILPEEAMDDNEIVKKACLSSNNGAALEYASDRLKNDRTFIQDILSKMPRDNHIFR